MHPPTACWLPSVWWSKLREPSFTWALIYGLLFYNMKIVDHLWQLRRGFSLQKHTQKAPMNVWEFRSNKVRVVTFEFHKMSHLILLILLSSLWPSCGARNNLTKFTWALKNGLLFFKRQIVKIGGSQPTYNDIFHNVSDRPTVNLAEIIGCGDIGHTHRRKLMFERNQNQVFHNKMLISENYASKVTLVEGTYVFIAFYNQYTRSTIWL